MVNKMLIKLLLILNISICSISGSKVMHHTATRYDLKGKKVTKTMRTTKVEYDDNGVRTISQHLEQTLHENHPEFAQHIGTIREQFQDHMGNVREKIISTNDFDRHRAANNNAQHNVFSTNVEHYHGHNGYPNYDHTHSPSCYDHRMSPDADMQYNDYLATDPHQSQSLSGYEHDGRRRRRARNQRHLDYHSRGLPDSVTNLKNLHRRGPKYDAFLANSYMRNSVQSHPDSVSEGSNSSDVEVVSEIQNGKMVHTVTHDPNENVDSVAEQIERGLERNQHSLQRSQPSEYQGYHTRNSYSPHTGHQINTSHHRGYSNTY